MLCRSPFVKDSTGRSWKVAAIANLDVETRRQLRLNSTPFPCGQCLPCLINKRRIWTLRMILESFCHSYSSFITLTYDDEHLPVDGLLSKRDAQLFLKRLRKSLHPRRFRYYLCGEYGPQTHRPHYHAILFGVHPQMDADAINRCWCKGFTVIGQDTSDAAIQYVAGYVTKKITKRGDSAREFALMSRRPALGSPFLHNLKFLEDSSYDALFSGQDVPFSLRIGPRSYPLGRTLRCKLGLLVDKDTSCDRWLYDQGREIAEAAKRFRDVGEHFAALDDGRARRLKARFKIYSKRDVL